MPQPHAADSREVVVHLLLDRVQISVWLIAIPAGMTNEEAFEPLTDKLLAMAVSDGDIPADDRIVSFTLRDADPVEDFDLYLQQASETGSLH